MNMISYMLCYTTYCNVCLTNKLYIENNKSYWYCQSVIKRNISIFIRGRDNMMIVVYT